MRFFLSRFYFQVYFFFFKLWKSEFVDLGIQRGNLHTEEPTKQGPLVLMQLDYLHVHDVHGVHKGSRISDPVALARV